MSPFNPIVNLFGTSPVRPLQKHMAKVAECVAQLDPLFDAVLANDLAAVNEVQERIVGDYIYRAACSCPWNGATCWKF
jgi:uncharacterized protein Yka (UPF0111/DUF47 family)